MLPRLLAAALMAAALLALPASASAKPLVALSENNPEMFGDPLFRSLGVKHARVVTPYDVMVTDSDYRPQLTSYLETARAQGVEVLVSFQHSRGDASVCKSRANQRLPVCALPTTKRYAAAVKAFFARFPWVKVVSPWNEINHFTQPTSRNARAAGRFTDIAAKACGRRCKVVAMDILDQADNAKAKTPRYTKTIRYIKTMRRAMKTRPRICGLHNYSGVNRFTDAGTRTLIRAMGCREVWLTETGGLYKFGSFWTPSTMKGCSSAESCQLKATKYLFTLARRNRQVKRVYVYSFYGGLTERFDSGIVAFGAPRPAYEYLKKKV